MRILLRTACGCERLILEDFGPDQPVPEIRVPCMQSRIEWNFNMPPKQLMEPIQVRDRTFKLTNKGYLGPADGDVYVYEEVL